MINHELIKNLRLKRDLLAENNEGHKKIRTALIVLSGAMRGVSGSGMASALHVLGLENVFDVVIGISTGAPIAAYFLAGPEQVLLGTSVYYQDLPPRFIKYFRRPIVDIDFLENVFRHGKKELNTKAVHGSRSDFFIGLTDLEEAKGVLINAKSAKPNMITAIKASTAMPGLYGHSVEVNGRLCIDGALDNPFPIQEIIEKFQSTDILVIANRTIQQVKRVSLMERICRPLFLINTPSAIKKLIKRRKRRFQQSVEFFNSLKTINTGILWSPISIDRLARDSCKLRKAAVASADMVLKIFGETQKEVRLF